MVKAVVVEDQKGGSVITEGVFPIIVYLAPGFIASGIISSFVFRRRRKNFERIAEVVVFSLVAYMVYSIFFNKPPIKFDEATQGGFVYYWKGFLFLAAFSFVVALVFCFILRNELHIKLARKLGITSRTGRESVWDDAFSKKKQYVVVTLEDNRKFFGWPEFYSELGEPTALFLHQPKLINQGGYCVPMQSAKDKEVDGLLLTSELKIAMIEFVDNKYC